MLSPSPSGFREAQSRVSSGCPQYLWPSGHVPFGDESKVDRVRGLRLLDAFPWGLEASEAHEG